MNRWMLIAVLSLVTSSASAVVRRHDVADSSYTNLGNSSSAAVWITTTSGCSGTLVAPDWVLTACHCVDDLSSADYHDLEIGNGSIEGSNRLASGVKTIELHPDWINFATNVDNGIDVALIQLESPTTVLPLNRHSGSVASLLGDAVTYVGYGWTGTGDEPGVTDDGLKRGGTNVIDILGSTYHPSYSNNLMFTDFDGPASGDPTLWGSSGTPTSREANLSAGDSGGPWIGGGVLVGVSSFTEDLNINTYGTFTGATAVSPHNNWINQVMGGVNWNTRTSSQFHSTAAWGDGRIPSQQSVQFSMPTLGSETPIILFDRDTQVAGLQVEFGPHSLNLQDFELEATSTVTVDEDGRMIVRFGQFNAAGTAGMRLGQNGFGRFTQSTGGNVTVTNNLSLGNTANGAGQYDLITADEAQAGHLRVLGVLSVGRLGKGDFVQSTGEVDAVTLYLGEFAGASGEKRGRYVLNNGDVDVQTLEVGRAGTGSFEQHAGDVYVGVSHLRIGRESTGDGTYDIDGGRLRTETGLDIYVGFDGVGTVIQDGGIVQGGRALQLALNAESKGNYWATAGTATFPGAMIVGRLGEGRMEVSGTASISAGDALVVARDAGSFGEITQVGGLVNIQRYAYLGFSNDTDGNYYLNGGEFRVGENLVVGYGDTGLMRQTGGTAKVTGNLTIAQEATSTGRYELQGGTLNVSSGQINFGAGNGEFEFTGGTLHVGVFNGDLTNQGGTLAPGSSPGTTTINGDYTQQSGKLLMELASTGADRLVVNGDLALGGALEVRLLGGLMPVAGSAFNLLDWTGTISGSFASIVLPALDAGFGWNTSQLYTTGVLSVVGGGGGPIVGDYNDNGVVDASDYTIWRNLFGTNAVLINRDPNNSGVIGPADFASWKKNFGLGMGVGSSAEFHTAVPEPGVLVSIVIGIALIAPWYRRRPYLFAGERQ